MWLLDPLIIALLYLGLFCSVVMCLILAHGVTLWTCIAYHAGKILSEVPHMRWYSLAEIIGAGRSEFFTRRAIYMLCDDEIAEARFFPRTSSLRPEGEDFIHARSASIEFRIIGRVPPP